MYKRVLLHIGISVTVSTIGVWLLTRGRRREKVTQQEVSEPEVVLEPEPGPPIIISPPPPTYSPPPRQTYYTPPSNYNREFLRSYLWRWDNLKRWIDPYESAGLRTVWDVSELTESRIRYMEKTVPGIGPKGGQILRELCRLSNNVKSGRTNITSIGYNISLRCLPR